MSYRKLLCALFIVFGVLSCTSDEDGKKGEDEVKTVETEVVGTVPHQSMAIAIEGMSCEMACVSSIKKTLAGIDGISNLQINFNTDNAVDTAFFDFDESVTPSNTFVEAIQSINGGIYKVNGVEIERTVSEGAQINHSSSSGSDKTDKDKYRKFNFPSLLDLVKTVGL